MGSGTYSDVVGGVRQLKKLATNFSAGVSGQAIGTRSDGYRDPSFDPPLGLTAGTLAAGTHLLSIPNGNFEDGLKGWTTYTSGTGSFIVDNSISVTGVNSIKLTTAVANDIVSITSGMFPCGEGIPIGVYFRLRLAGGSPTVLISVQFFDKTKTNLNQSLFNPGGAPIPVYSFLEYGSVVTPPAGTRYATVIVETYSTVGSIWVDEIRASRPLADALPLPTSGVSAPYITGQLERDGYGALSINNWIPQALRSGIRANTDTSDHTNYVKAALASGENDIAMGPGTFNMIDAATMAQYSQRLRGSGMNATTIKIGQGVNTSASGIIVINHYAEISNIGFSFYQPNTSSRSSLVAHPPAIKSPSSAFDITLRDIAIRQGMTGIDLTGNVYGKYDRLLLQCFNNGIKIDGSLEFWDAGLIQGSTLGVSNTGANLNNIYYDGNGYLANIGRTDGFSIACLKSYCQPIIFQDNGSGAPTGTIAQLQLDTNYGKLRQLAGRLSVGSLYSSKLGGNDTADAAGEAWSGASAIAISHEGGEGNYGAVDMFGNGPDSAPTIACYAGNLNIIGGTVRQYDYKAPAVSVTGGFCSLGPALQLVPDTSAAQARTVPMVTCNGGGLSMEAKVAYLSGGSGDVVAFATDSVLNYYDPNSNPGATYNFPSLASQGFYGAVTQYGQASVSTDASVSFNVPFKHHVFSVTANIVGSGSNLNILNIEQFSLTAFVAHVRTPAGAGASATISYTAVGN